MNHKRLITQIHRSGKRFVFAVTGGGATALGELLTVPGGSRSVLECIVPYSVPALTEWIGGTPDQLCSDETARAMAMTAFERARQLDRSTLEGDQLRWIGIGCTASLASDPPKKGPHRIHVAWQSARRTAVYSLELIKGARTRYEEERVCARLILLTAAEAAAWRPEVNERSPA